MKLSVIIPAFNEAATIVEVLQRVERAKAGEGAPGEPAGIEILVVDDASTDDTARRVESFAAARKGSGATIRLLRHAGNRGKGAAIRTALASATGDVVIVQDADLEYDPADYASILEAMRREGADVVFGSRILGGNPHSYLRYYYGGRLLTLLFNALYGTRLTDLTTCYKAFHRETIQALPLSCRRFEFCPEVAARLARRGVRILEVPISYHPRSLQQGKKIRWHDGLKAIATMLSLRWRGQV